MYWFQRFLSQIPMFHFSMYAWTATGHTHAYIVNSIIWPRPWTSDPSIKSQHSKIRFHCVIWWSGWGIPPIEGIIKKKIIRCQNIGLHKEGESWVFLWIFGLTRKGKHILQSMDRTITTRSKLHKQNERIWLIFFDQYMGVYHFQNYLCLIMIP